MIESLQFNSALISDSFKKLSKVNDWRTKTFLENNKHLLDLPLLKNKIEFQKGVNIIFDRNGTGKTTLLRALSNIMGCYHVGFTYYDNNFSDNIEHYNAIKMNRWEAKELDIKIDSNSYNSDYYIPLYDIRHDGSFSYFCDPRNVCGEIETFLSLEMAHFERIKTFSDKSQSTGQLNHFRMAEYFDLINNVDKIPNNNFIESCKNDKRCMFNDGLLEFISPNIPKDVPTFFFDEPESALDELAKRDFFIKMNELSKRDDIQVIMICHNSLCLGIENANIITSDQAYIDELKNLIQENKYFSLD